MAEVTVTLAGDDRSSEQRPGEGTGSRELPRLINDVPCVPGRFYPAPRIQTRTLRPHLVRPSLLRSLGPTSPVPRDPICASCRRTPPPDPKEKLKVL